MRALPEQLLHCTVRIEITTLKGKSSGTGFFYNFLTSENQHIPVVVTNKHVVRDAILGEFHLTLQDKNGNPDIGNHFKFQINDFKSLWIDHPDENIDLTILPLASLLTRVNEKGFTFYYTTLNSQLIPTSAQIDDFFGFDEILMVGYPNGLWDSVNNLPIFRSGVAASHPKYNFMGKEEFLIDCACFPGSSGSPVFLYNANGWKDRNRNFYLDQERLLFLGILYSGPTLFLDGTIDAVEQAKALQIRSVATLNLGFVIKSSKLQDFDEVLRRILERNPEKTTQGPCVTLKL